MKSSIPLDQISVAAPCHVSWDSMLGDDQVRFCGQCQQRVYNLSAMAAADAHAFVEQRNGTMCIRFYKRADGTMMTKDCPVGLRAIKRRVAMIASAAVAAVLACLSFGVLAIRGDGNGEAEPINPFVRLGNWFIHPIAQPRGDFVMGAICAPEVVAPAEELPAPEVGVPAGDDK